MRTISNPTTVRATVWRGVPLLLFLLAGFPLHRPVSANEGHELFETKIRPVLANECYRCHGEKKQRGGLRADLVSALLEGGHRGPALVPGKPDESLILTALRYVDEDLQMPPSGRLSETVLEDFAEWIRLGAPHPEESPEKTATETETFNLEERAKHWSFQPLRRADKPSRTGAIDEFVLERLNAANLSPAPEADRRSLARRVYFDLVGLPPTVEQLGTFLQDRRPGAYERLVDRLLDSPHFGERWGRHWLDLVRYCETKGFEYDFLIANAHHYRDYVIRAFNADVPYDQLLLEHVAGDLLDSPRLHPEEKFDESVLGTGFWFFGEEGHSPVDTRVDHAERLANQIDVFGKAFLGLTVACAQCHDHKFDPISAKDYYALSGFLQSASYRQVRYESDRRNRAVSRKLDELRERTANDVVRECTGVIERAARALDTSLLAARDVLTKGPLTARGEKEEDILFEDFEGKTYGKWKTTGTAFGVGPVSLEEIPGYQDISGHVGKRLVTSHHARGGEDVRAADAHLGTLTSPAFVIERDFIHLLVSGGDHEGKTCVRLVVEGDVVHSVKGRRENRLREARFDVQEHRGKTAKLEVIDEHEGGWGIITLDDIVFSDKEQRPVPLNPESWRRRVQREARPGRIDAALLERWVDELRLASNDPTHPFHAFGLLAGEQGRRDPLPIAEAVDRALETVPPREDPGNASGESRVLVDYGRDEEVWLQNGVTFGEKALPAGSALLTSRRGLPLAAIHPRTAATQDPLWNRLRTAPGTQRDSGAIRWIQAGRTLKTRSFRLETGKLRYLVRGSGHVYASVDGHRMIHPPLHRGLVKTWDGNARYRWIEHDLGDYVGHRVHLEFSPRERDGSPLAIARIVEGDAPADPVAPINGRLRDLLTRSRKQKPSTLARAYGAWLTEAAKKARTKGLEDTQEGHDLAEILNFFLARPDLLGIDVDGRSPGSHSERAARELADLTSEIREVSATAPALHDGTGYDEHVLLRGNPKTPGELAPRRFLEAIDGPEPVQPGKGSGRLELARRLISPDNPLVSRVWVNRAWHHLFGRGLVGSVDNLGVLGQEPSHPELLDHLATTFLADGWSTKRLIRSIVLSRTYRRSSQASDRSREVDPDNRLLQHMPVRRLQAEAIRDAILTVSGRLDRKLYGASVPVHLTPFMDGRGRPGKSGPLDGDGRRGLYLSVRRNFLVPFFLAFDFPKPASTRGRRTVSNVPAQALTLMNDPFVVAQARTWANRVLSSDQDTGQRLERLYLTAFARPPTEAERSEAERFLAEQQTLREDGAEVSAWTDLCHVLFNVKEFIYLR